MSVTSGLRIVEITDPAGVVLAPDWLARAEAVHRQLRQHLPADYSDRMQSIFAGGARMTVLCDGDAVVGVAVWRLIDNTFDGRKLYVDDLVTDAARRSQGLGAQLLRHLEGRARALGCDVLGLDSGTQRTQAHRFYFREGMVIPSFNFRKTLT